jgi:(p)ppGpp synthase/HD superfamily hydrolase
MTPRLSTAINKATWAHRNQTRKGSGLPYILHPYSVMCIAGQATSDEDILIACLMHDVIEDVPEEYSVDEIRTDFGDRVLDIILGVTKNDTLPSWQDRADAYLHHLEHEATDESVIVSCADKIHNLMSILADYEEIGEELWGRFNAGKERQVWWYQAILEVVIRRLPELPLNKQLSDLVAQLKMI